MLNPDTHQKTQRYCPSCYKRLIKVIETGLTFCPTQDPDGCDYEVTGQSLTPLNIIQAEQSRRKKNLQHFRRDVKIEYFALCRLEGEIFATDQFKKIFVELIK